MRAFTLCCVFASLLRVRGDDNFGIMASVELEPGTVVWSISQPDVTRRDTPYPDISFKQLDEMTVLAGIRKNS